MYAHKKHLFFDLDMTVAPARQPITPHMYELLASLPHDITIISGQLTEKIEWQTNGLPAIRMGQNGNHALDLDGAELWYTPLDEHHQKEILDHVEALIGILDHDLNHEWSPIENRGAQITFSPIGNTAPVPIKMAYDPDKKKRFSLLERIPFVSDELTLKIGGSTSFDYIHKTRHKGTNVEKLITHKGWEKDDCLYFGDGLFPGGNDEAVIGVIDTHPVDDHEHTYALLRQYFG